MKLEYASEKVKLQCTDVKVALKLFGGDKNLVNSLFARINAIVSAYTIKDIIFIRYAVRKPDRLVLQDECGEVLIPQDVNGNTIR